MSEDYDQLLKHFRLRATASRQAILHLFLEHDFALSHHDIEEKIYNSLDRVTIYRTLKTFIDKGLIHKVLDDQGGLKYALCDKSCSFKEHHHDHVHFKCKKCSQTICLDITVPGIKLPKGYKADEVSLLIQGTCEHCL